MDEGNKQGGTSDSSFGKVPQLYHIEGSDVFELGYEQWAGADMPNGRK